MLNLAVYGQHKWSHIMKECLETEYSDLLNKANGETVCVKYFLAPNPSADDEIGYDKLAELYNSHQIDAIIIPKEYYIKYNEIVQNLVRRQININDIYNGMRLIERIHELLKNDESLIPSLITPMLSDSYLSYLEFHVADHCNLNCKYCTHYSPLVKEPVFTDYDKFEQDIWKLKEYIEDIGVIRILGGEPLLSSRLNEFIELSRRVYPKSIITIVTNGMIVDKMSDELIECIKRNMAFIHISYYPPLEERIGTIQKFLVDNDIHYTLSPKMDKFLKMQTLSKADNTDYFYSCFQGTCTCLHDGKLAPCYALFTTKYFNEAFDKDIPCDGAIDLYNSQTTEDIKLKLLYPLERCRYCNSGTLLPWEIVGKNSKLEDWVDE